MVNYNPKTWVSLIVHSYGKHVMKTLLPAMVFVTLMTFGVCYLFVDYFQFDFSQYSGTTTVHSLLGIVLGLFWFSGPIRPMTAGGKEESCGGFVIMFQYYAIPAVVLIAYILLSVELIAEEIEDPFGLDPNDLPTDDISKNIRDNVKEILHSYYPRAYSE